MKSEEKNISTSSKKFLENSLSSQENGFEERSRILTDPLATFEPMPGMFVTEINPTQWPNILISIIENDGRMVGTRISHVEYTLPVIEVPPPTAMMASDA